MCPAILDKAVARIRSRGVQKDKVWPFAVAALQKAGDLKPGSVKATPKGARRGAMTQAQRHKTPP